MSKLANYINRHVIGNVFERAEVCAAYAADRSLVNITPRLVATPDNAQDIRKLVYFANQLALKEYSLPLTVRGTGLDKTGAAVGEGVIISLENLNAIEEIDTRGRLVRVQPGLTIGTLNSALSLQGLWLPIDCDPEATIGGLIANCPADDALRRYGGIYPYVERVEMVASSGDVLQLAPYNARVISEKSAKADFEGTLYRRMQRLLDAHADTIVDRAMRPFDNAGYANITKVQQPRGLSLLPLLFASQGTLGIVTDIILAVEPIPPEPRQLLIAFQDLNLASRFLNFACELEPYTLKVYDPRIIRAAARQGKQMSIVNVELTRGLFVLVSFDYRPHKTNQKVRQCLDILPPGTAVVEETPENSAAFREFNTAILGYLNEAVPGERAPVLDDVRVPSFRFTDYLNGLKTLEATLGVSLPVFGSFATSNYSVRPEIDCTTFEGQKKIIEFIKLYSQLIEDCEGSLTGGTPEGRIKALTGAQAIPLAEQEVYREIKRIFDPNNIFNPGVKLDVDLINTVRQLRAEPQKRIIKT